MTSSLPKAILLSLILVAASCRGAEETVETRAPSSDTTVQTTTSTPPVSLSPQATRALDQVADARARWETTNRTTYHYSASFFRFPLRRLPTDRACFEPEVLRVEVDDGVVVRAIDERGCELDVENGSGAPLTVPELFDYLDETIRSSSAGDDLEIRFQDDGFPALFRNGTAQSFVTDSFIGSRAPALKGDRVLQELEAARTRWDGAEIDSYRLTVDIGCFCADFGPFVVTVIDGEVQSTTPEPTNSWTRNHYLTVPDLLDNVSRLAYSANIQVTFHPELGYLELLDADPVLNTADDELSLRITDFEVLE